MSPDEVKDFCKNIMPYELRVRLKLKNEPVPLTGRIHGVDADQFKFIGDDKLEQRFRYVWVARITNA